MREIICFGEYMLSLQPQGYLRFLQADRFDLFYTGAEANVAASLAQFGKRAQLVTRLPEHAIGDAAVASLRKYNIAADHVARGGERIGVIYTEKGAAQRASTVIYDRKNSALAQAPVDCFDWDTIFQNADWFHFTGITPALSENTAELCRRACAAAKRHHVTISCDLNYHKKLWTTEQAGRTMRELLQYVDVLIANEEDAEKVLGIRAGNTDVTRGELDRTGYAEVACQISDTFQIPYVATTLRKSISASDNDWSAMLYHNGAVCFSRNYHIHIVNRVGGGDSFAGGLIYALHEGYEDQRALEFAAAASCLKHSIEQDFNLVSVAEVTALMDGDGSGRVQR